MNQISYHRRQPISSTLRPAVFDRDVAAIDVTGFAQPFEKGRQLSRQILGRSAVDKPDHWHRLPLRMRDKRPNRCRTTNNLDEIAPPHVSPRGPRLVAMPKA
jgi:hypothetical protein